MMKIWGALLAAGLALTASADPIKPKSIKFLCMTGMPTTSFSGYTEGDKVHVIVIHHNGVRYMPIEYAPVTPNDLDMLRQRADLLMRLGDRLEVTFPLNECKVYSDGVLSCLRGETYQIDGLKVRAFAFNTSVNVTSFQEYEFIKREAMLSLDINDKLRHIQMPYEPEDCDFEISYPEQAKN